MNERFALELLRDRRISVEEALTLLGHQTNGATPASSQPQRPRRRRRVDATRRFTIEDHYRMVETYLKNGRKLTVTADELGIKAATIQNHLQYAGVHDCFTQDDVNRVMNWRRRRGLYLDLGPAQMRPRYGA